MRNDAIIQAWMPRVEIALVAQYLEKKGFRIRYMSEIARIAIQGLTIEALEKGMKMPSIEEAEQILTFMFGKRPSLNPSGRRGKNLMENLMEEEEGGSSGGGPHERPPRTRNVDEQQIKDQLKALRHFEKGEKNE